MRSKFEERFAEDLKKRGIGFAYEADSFAYTVPRAYTPDFRVTHKSKPTHICPSNTYIETKGYFTPGDRAKTLRVLSLHPNLDLRFVFQNAQNRLSKTSKTTYAQWCDKHGIPWAQGTAPKAWFGK